MLGCLGSTSWASWHQWILSDAHECRDPLDIFSHLNSYCRVLGHDGIKYAIVAGDIVNCWTAVVTIHFRMTSNWAPEGRPDHSCGAHKRSTLYRARLHCQRALHRGRTRANRGLFNSPLRIGCMRPHLCSHEQGDCAIVARYGVHEANNHSLKLAIARQMREYRKALYV